MSAPLHNHAQVIENVGPGYDISQPSNIETRKHIMQKMIAIITTDWYDVMQGQSMEDLLGPYPRIKKWMQDTAQSCAPHHAEVSRPLMQAVKTWPRR